MLIVHALFVAIVKSCYGHYACCACSSLSYYALFVMFVLFVLLVLFIHVRTGRRLIMLVALSLLPALVQAYSCSTHFSYELDHVGSIWAQFSIIWGAFWLHFRPYGGHFG